MTFTLKPMDEEEIDEQLDTISGSCRAALLALELDLSQALITIMKNMKTTVLSFDINP